MNLDSSAMSDILKYQTVIIYISELEIASIICYLLIAKISINVDPSPSSCCSEYRKKNIVTKKYYEQMISKI